MQDVSRWLLLIHQIPPEPLYLRAKILRRIKQLGAVAVKKSAYVLPNRPDCLEDLHWLRKEILAGGGEAWIVEGRFLAGSTDEEITREFVAARTEELAALAADCRAALDAGQARPGRFRKRLAEIEAVDFFEAPGANDLKAEVKAMLDAMERERETDSGVPATGARPGNATWVTRRDVGVDRMASAWLIRRFIDPGARFRFTGGEHQPGEIRFDTFEGEYTHEAGLCTFEVLMNRTGLTEPGLATIAAIVHDLDLKDARHGRPETAGVAAAVEGIRRRCASDADRLEQAAVYFDILLASFAGRTDPYCAS